MEPKILPIKLEIFDNIVVTLNATIKNSFLYPADHPLFYSAVKNFHASLKRWFATEDRLDIGISPDNILLSGSYVRQKNRNYIEAGNYLNKRGIIAISFLKSIEIKELASFFVFIKNDVKIIRRKGGVVKNIPPTPNLKIKEIDYQSLLSGSEDVITGEEKDLWQSLSRIGEDVKIGKLPESKIEFLIDFLKDPKKSAHVLNKIYKQAVVTLNDKTIVENIKRSLLGITKYFEQYPSINVKDTRISLKDIITGLDPNLVINLFERERIGDENISLAEKVTEGFSDDMIADFMVSLLTGEGKFNENVFKVFNKLAPEKEGISNVALMVTDKLFEKNLLDKDALSKMQFSIKEIFKSQPDNDFISQMYKITVDAFATGEIDMLSHAGELALLKKEYIDFLKEENLKKEKARLLLNIIWLENDADEFIKFTDTLVNSFNEILNPKYINTLKEILELFTEKLRPEQKGNAEINKEIKKVVDAIINREVLEKIISFIPALPDEQSEDIIYILLKTKEHTANLLLSAFISEKNPINRQQYGNMISKAGKAIAEEISIKLGDLSNLSIHTIKDLFKILKTVDPERARPLAAALMKHKDAQLRLEALDGFRPRQKEELEFIFNIFQKDRKKEIRNMILPLIIKSNDKEVIEKLFNRIKGNYLIKAIRLCGDFKAEKALPYLKNIFLKKPLFFNAGRTDKLRIECAVSLARLGTDEAREVIKSGLTDRRKSVRNMCSMILEPKKDA